MPLPVYIFAAIFRFVAAWSVWLLVSDFDQSDLVGNSRIGFWILFDGIVAAGLVLRWRLGYLLFMVHTLALIVITIGATLMIGISASVYGPNTKDLVSICMCIALVIGCFYLYRYFRKGKIRELYF